MNDVALIFYKPICKTDSVKDITIKFENAQIYWHTESGALGHKKIVVEQTTSRCRIMKKPSYFMQRYFFPLDCLNHGNRMQACPGLGNQRIIKKYVDHVCKSPEIHYRQVRSQCIKIFIYQAVFHHT